MHIVDFLEARIAEEESALLHVDRRESAFATKLAEHMAAECAQKRAIVDYWKRSAAGTGIADPADADRPLAHARLSMLSILVAGYRGHPEYSEDWG